MEYYWATFTKQEAKKVLEEFFNKISSAIPAIPKVDIYVYSKDICIDGIDEVKVRSIFKFLYHLSAPFQEKSVFDDKKGYKIKYSYKIFDDLRKKGIDDKLLKDYFDKIGGEENLRIRIEKLEEKMKNTNS